MNLTGKNITFRRNRSHSNPTRILILLGMVVLAVFLLRSVESDQIQSPFLPTPYPTRASNSFALEGETYFVAGNLPKSIEAYRKALELDPDNAKILSELARIMVYSSANMTTDQEKKDRLTEALETATKAVELAPEESDAHAIRALTLDWNSNPVLAGDQRSTFIAEAEQEATRALQLNNKNALAMAYFAEIMLDQANYTRAEQLMAQALEQGDSFMDVHRVNGTLQETLGNYGRAIEEYQRALEINPKLTFLHIAIGVNFRQLKRYDEALNYFSQAATINEQLGVRDPLPYLAIGKTYSQTGDFFAASLNTRKGLQFNPYNQDTYAALGVVYFKARNYESAIPALKCAIRGCPPEESCAVRRDCEDPTAPQITLTGLPLSSTTVVYYYTYGSALAGMYRPRQKGMDYCEEATAILDQVRKGFSEDTVIMSIIEPSEQICRSFGYTVK